MGFFRVLCLPIGLFYLILSTMWNNSVIISTSAISLGTSLSIMPKEISVLLFCQALYQFYQEISNSGFKSFESLLFKEWPPLLTSLENIVLIKYYVLCFGILQIGLCTYYGPSLKEVIFNFMLIMSLGFLVAFAISFLDMRVFQEYKLPTPPPQWSTVVDYVALLKDVFASR